ncbi:hypothetical protein LC593_16330 [Nostoc sp. CHAB 5844]|nr:hypothetical protein [Nostoc sp. CHAB 5844]
MTDKNFKRPRIFSVVAIAYFVTACSTLSQLSIHQPISKLLAAKVLDSLIKSQEGN